MILKLVNEAGGCEIVEFSRLTRATLPDHAVEVKIFDAKDERIGRYIVLDHPNVSGQWTRGYVMDRGTTFETIRQKTSSPRGGDGLAGSVKVPL